MTDFVYCPECAVMVNATTAERFDGLCGNCWSAADVEEVAAAQKKRPETVIDPKELL